MTLRKRPRRRGTPQALAAQPVLQLTHRQRAALASQGLRARRVRVEDLPHGAGAVLRGQVCDAAQDDAAAPPVALDQRYASLAHELHDSVAQELGFLAFQARRIDLSMDDPAKARPLVAELREVLGRVQKHVRALIAGSRMGLQGRSLRDALADAVAEFSRRSSIVFELDNRLDTQALPPPGDLQVLQIVREALANVVRHSHATRARVVLHRDGQGLQIVVEDDGIGIGIGQAARDDTAGRYGIASMRERAGSIGARFALEPVQPQGTRVVLRVPQERVP